MQDIYSDEGKSGTSLRKRDAFKRMMRDAKDQKMDLIICASISRFARNFSDCMTQIAALKTMHPAHPIGVYFETENIYTLNPSSQYSLDIQALLADWESGNKSRRMILSYDQRIMTGQYPVADLMGYRHTKDGQLVIEPEEAKTVRFIFLAFIYGYNCDQIAAVLTQKKRSTLRGKQEWNGMMVANIMKNERRWGDLEARKSIVVDYKLGKVTKNNGNRCSAYVPEHHEAIVSPEIARAAHLVASSRKKCGVQDIVVIQQGTLKGFVLLYWMSPNGKQALLQYRFRNVKNLKIYLRQIYRNSLKTYNNQAMRLLREECRHEFWASYEPASDNSGGKPENECWERCYPYSWKSGLYLRFAEERSEVYCNHAVCCGASHVL